MLHADVCEAVEAGKFSVYSVDTIDDGIELLTGIPAGREDDNGRFPDGSVNHRVAARLTEYATKMHAYLGHSEAPEEKKTRGEG